MRSPKQVLADRQAWKEYRREIDEQDRQLDAMEAEGIDPASATYREAWCDRMGYAANRYPGAPEPEAEAEEELEL